jgi:hypothetical protein
MASTTAFSQLSAGLGTDLLNTLSLNNQSAALVQSNASSLLQDHLQLFRSTHSLDRPSLSLGTWDLPTLNRGVVNLSAISALPPGEYQIQAVASSSDGTTLVSNTELLQMSSVSSSSGSPWQVTQTPSTDLPVPFTPQIPAGVDLTLYDSAALNQTIQGAIANALQTNQGLIFQITVQAQDWLTQGASIQAQLEGIIQDIYANVPPLP